jgi:single-strand DNA-binding protein
MRGVNKVVLIGNLGKEPDLQHLEGNIAVAKFPLATTETYKDKNGTLISQTEWHTVVLWRGLADLAQRFLHKGSLIYLEGRIRTRTWEDKDKNKRFSTEIIGDNLVMLDKRKEHSDTAPPDVPGLDTTGLPDMGYDNTTSDSPGSKDDLPF